MGLCPHRKCFSFTTITKAPKIYAKSTKLTTKTGTRIYLTKGWCGWSERRGKILRGWCRPGSTCIKIKSKEIRKLHFVDSTLFLSDLTSQYHEGNHFSHSLPSNLNPEFKFPVLLLFALYKFVNLMTWGVVTGFSTLGLFVRHRLNACSKSTIRWNKFSSSGLVFSAWYTLNTFSIKKHK